MNSFLQLWEDSLRELAAADQQRFVRERFEARCRENGFFFWNGGPPVPIPASNGILLGVGAYDRNDLHLLDQLVEERVMTRSTPLDVTVFLLDTFVAVEAFVAAIPVAIEMPFRNPIVVGWRSDDPTIVCSGYTARMWIRNEISAPHPGDGQKAMER